METKSLVFFDGHGRLREREMRPGKKPRLFVCALPRFPKPRLAMFDSLRAKDAQLSSDEDEARAELAALIAAPSWISRRSKGFSDRPTAKTWKTLRERGFTDARVAVAIGVTSESIRKWRSGRAAVPKELARRVFDLIE